MNEKPRIRTHELYYFLSSIFSIYLAFIYPHHKAAGHKKALFHSYLVFITPHSSLLWIGR